MLAFAGSCARTSRRGRPKQVNMILPKDFESSWLGLSPEARVGGKAGKALLGWEHFRELSSELG